MKTAIVFLAVVALALATPFDVKKRIQGKAIAGGVFCHECEKLVTDGEKLGEGEVEKYVHDAIGAICDAAGFLSGLCKKEFDKLADKLIDSIIKKADPHTACKEIDLC